MSQREEDHDRRNCSEPHTSILEWGTRPRVTAWVCDGTPASLANLRVEVRVRELAKWEDRHWLLQAARAPAQQHGASDQVKQAVPSPRSGTCELGRSSVRKVDPPRGTEGTGRRRVVHTCRQNIHMYKIKIK